MVPDGELYIVARGEENTTWICDVALHITHTHTHTHTRMMDLNDRASAWMNPSYVMCVWCVWFSIRYSGEDARVVPDWPNRVADGRDCLHTPSIYAYNLMQPGNAIHIHLHMCFVRETYMRCVVRHYVICECESKSCVWRVRGGVNYVIESSLNRCVMVYDLMLRDNR